MAHTVTLLTQLGIVRIEWLSETWEGSDPGVTPAGCDWAEGKET